ncbi:MAG: hypothetical protein KatS3mg068_2687 [Candidatus Sericytochromatia bacterium]|nr:MAG: hypothetical protein KatS3mg068_2687 [Candidatus Sericytochromatia bacterium]
MKNTNNIPLFILCIIVGISILTYVYLKNPKDQQIDSWLIEDINNLIYRAYKKFDIESTQLIHEPLYIIVPEIIDVANTPVLFKIGKDKKIRFTPISITIIFLLKNHLLVYVCILDFISGNILNEKTYEYLYKDIISVETISESAAYNVPKIGIVQLKESEYFKITTSGGTSLKILVNDKKLFDIFIQLYRYKIPYLNKILIDLLFSNKGFFYPVNPEDIVQKIRKVLREKKV